MRRGAPFQPDDLDDLGVLLSQASAVVAMEDVYDGHTDVGAVGMRHDCDNVISPAVHMAEWEAERGWRATYYILHTAPYWNDKRLLRACLERIVGLGHTIGIHNNAVADSVRFGGDPTVILDLAVHELRSYGFEIRSTVAHGDPLCHVERFVNDEMFLGCERTGWGGVPLRPVPLGMFGLEFDANWLPRGDYVSDSGGEWSRPFDTVKVPADLGQLHMLVHPDWWGEAFDRVQAAA